MNAFVIYDHVMTLFYVLLVVFVHSIVFCQAPAGGSHQKKNTGHGSSDGGSIRQWLSWRRAQTNSIIC